MKEEKLQCNSNGVQYSSTEKAIKAPMLTITLVLIHYNDSFTYSKRLKVQSQDHHSLLETGAILATAIETLYLIILSLFKNAILNFTNC
jgi:hypothetical protein